MKIHYFNCGCVGHHGDYALYVATKTLFKNVGFKLNMEIKFVAHPENTDLLLFGGGTVLGLFYWRQIYQLNKPTAVFGSGSATKNIPPELQKLLKQCFLVGVRGYNTQKTLQHFGVKAQVIGDLAFSVEMPNVTVEPHLVVGGVRKDSRNAWTYFQKVYDFLREQGWAVKLIMMGGNDRRDFYGFPVQPYTPSLEKTLTTIARASLVVGQRLHMTLYGLVAGRKAIGFEYVWGKMEDSLSVLNYPYYTTSVGTFKKMYSQLMNDSNILNDVKAKISRYRQIQKEFAKQILKKAVTLC